MNKVVWIIVALLFLAHHDFWYWEDRSLVMGFMPVGLFYHVIYSIAAGLVWLLAAKYAWPAHIEEWADEFEKSGTGENARGTSGGTSGGNH